jgi:hypothetical protein
MRFIVITDNTAVYMNALFMTPLLMREEGVF